MCGRFVLYDNSNFNFEDNFVPNYNIYPGTKVLIIKNDRKIIKVKWSLIPTWTDKIEIINARSETLEKKISFKNTERCIFIANGYFEWKRHNHKEIPYYHTFKNDNMFLGGIFDSTGACIVTRQSYPKISKIHNRQPVILNESDFSAWFNKSHDFSCVFSEKMIIYPVSRRVNYQFNNSIDNIIKVD